MKKRIDPVAIASVGNYITKQNEELKQVKNKLLENIQQISNYYKGTDSDIIIAKYQDRVNKLDILILNYENYAVYMKKISDAYSNNLSESKKSLNKVLETVSDNNNNSDSISTFSNLEVSENK